MRCGIATRCGTKRAGGRRGTEPKQAAYDDEEEERMLLLDDGGVTGGKPPPAVVAQASEARSGREAGEKRARSGREAGAYEMGGRVGGRTPRTRRRMSPCPMTYRKQEDTREQATADL
jgi:hypothetical protein